MKWSEQPLESLAARSTSGGTPATGEASYYGGDIPWLRTQEVNFNYIYDTEIKITDAGLENSAAKWIAENSVIVALYGNSAGRVAVSKIPLTTNQACGNFTIDPTKADYRFVYYALLKDYAVLHGMAKGAAQNNLNLAMVKDYHLRVPGLAIQQRIASILSAYDEAMENNRRRMGLLEKAARLLYEEWFVRLRFPGHEHTPFKSGIPQGWQRVPTPEAVDINPKTKLSDEEEHWYVEMADLPTDSMVIQNAIMRDGRSGSKFQNGDTLLARITPCLENGKTGFVNFMADGEAGRGSTEFIVLRSKRVTPEFVYCMARTYHFRENAIKSMVGSSGRQRVKESCFEKFQVLVPPTLLLNLFSESNGPIFRQIHNLHLQNRKLRATRNLLLPRLMSGEIEV